MRGPRLPVSAVLRGASFEALGPPVAPEYFHEVTRSSLFHSSHGAVALHEADQAQLWCLNAKLVE
jgi:hypothetical protein